MSGLDELRTEYHLSSNPALAIAACWYWIRKLQARYIAGDYVPAMDAASKAQPLLWTSVSLFEEAEYHFYGALARAACWDSALADEREQHLDALAAHHRQLQIWAESCPENFENRAALVGAEIARVEGRALDAMELYEQAIHSARANGFVHNEALANELAARFYAARGFEKIAQAYMQGARYGYLRWEPTEGAATRRTLPASPARTGFYLFHGHNRHDRAVECRDRCQGLTGTVERNCPAKANQAAHAAHG